MSYPIEPGSDLDRAIDMVAALGSGNPEDYPVTDMLQFKLLDPWNNAHMLALGIRVHMRTQGVTSPNNVAAALHGPWYGQAREKP